MSCQPSWRSGSRGSPRTQPASGGAGRPGHLAPVSCEHQLRGRRGNGDRVGEELCRQSWTYSELGQHPNRAEGGGQGGVSRANTARL